MIDEIHAGNLIVMAQLVTRNARNVYRPAVAAGESMQGTDVDGRVPETGSVLFSLTAGLARRIEAAEWRGGRRPTSGSSEAV